MIIPLIPATNHENRKYGAEIRSVLNLLFKKRNKKTIK